MSSSPLAIIVRPYVSQDLSDIRAALQRAGWGEQFAAGQLSSIQAFVADTKYARVYVPVVAGQVAGFSTVLFEPWNRLGQIHGLVIDPAWLSSNPTKKDGVICL